MESVAGAQTIYATDFESGGLYATQDDGRSSWGPETFRPVWVDPAYSGPAALTLAPGGVVVAYQEPPALVFVSPSGETSVLWQGPPLERPSAVAVLDQDRLVVSDAGLSWLFLLQRVKEEGEASWRIEPRFVAGAQIEASRRLVASGGELLALAQASGGIVSIRPEDGAVWRAQGLLERSPGVSLLEDVLNTRDFAFYRGVFYVTDERRLEVFTRTEKETYLAPLAASNVSFSRLVAGQDNLFVLDGESGVIRRWPRLIPSVVKLENDAEGSTRDLALLLRSLVCRDLIVARDFTVEKGPATVQEVLTLRNLFPGRPGGEASLSGGPRAASTSPRGTGCIEPAGESAERIYAEIFCLLNPGLCTEGAEAPARAILSIPLQAGQHVSLPDLEIQSYLTTRWLHLGRRPVSQHLDERIPSPDLRAQIDVAYISRINGASFRTPESVLTRAGFTQATPPRGDLEPGTILRYDKKNAEVVAGRLKTCMPAFQTALSEEPVRLPRTLVAELPSHLVPGGEESEGQLADWGVAKVEMTFDEAVAERIDTAGLERLDLLSCFEWKRGESYSLVLEALRARGARYRFVRKDGSVLYPSPEQLATAGFGGLSGESEGWSLVMDRDLYLGYRGVSWEPDPQLAAPASGSPAGELMIKANSPQDILAYSGSSLNLPVEAWRTKVLLPASVLKEASLLVPEWTRENSRVHLLSTEDLPPLEAHSTVLRDVPDDDPPAAVASARATQIWDELTNNRERLCKEIGYSRELVNDLYGVVVGVAESLGNLDIDHPDFLGDDGSSAWTEIGEDGQIRPMTRSKRRNVPEAQVRDPAETDHGTHVAGLIGSRRGRLGPGLLPHGELLLLDTSNVSRFHDALRVADARGEVGVMNFSFSYKSADAPEQLLPIMKGAQNLLFVVAAGNDAMELGGYQRFPVCWGTEVPHLIGVGASKWDKQFLDGWVGADGRVYGSNYGPRFVHILAPGFEIYSLAGGNGYTKETGTSQAAPLVAATAAALAQKLIPPLRIKARLIYTADWYPHLETRASGGFLNVRRALWQPELNLVWTQGEETIPKSIHYKRNPEMITLRGGEFRDQRGERSNVVRPVAFRNVLRITLTEGGFFRVIYLEEGSRHLRILVGTKVEGTLQCDRFQRWDGVKFVDAPDDCSKGFDVTSIQDYVAKVPPTVTF